MRRLLTSHMHQLEGTLSRTYPSDLNLNFVFLCAFASFHFAAPLRANLYLGKKGEHGPYYHGDNLSNFEISERLSTL